MSAPTSLSASGLAYSEDLRQTLLPSPRTCHLPPTLTAEAENCGMDGSTPLGQPLQKQQGNGLQGEGAVYLSHTAACLLPGKGEEEQ